jgi:hypothetical protein
MIKKFIITLNLATLIVGCSTGTSQLNSRTLANATSTHDGIKFKCAPEQLKSIEAEVVRYFESLNIKEEWYGHQILDNNLFFTLKTPVTDTNTLDLIKRPEYGITEAIVEVIKEDKVKKIKSKTVVTVSNKEIAMALMQHGRTTEFTSSNCTAEALIDHIGIRQNIVSWAEKVAWIWPDGTPAAWNEKYWKKGSPITEAPVHVIINDMFYNEEKYSIGCYTATKMVVIQGVLDYYQRIKKDIGMVKKIEDTLLNDKEPLVGIEPGAMWSFEKDFDHNDKNRAGKLLKIQYGVAPRNVVPGEWIYLLNTDEVSYEKRGYEGSNAIYLGRNKLDDYYNDHNHYYYFEEKLDEVWQWRNGVYSRSRHASKIKPLTHSEIELLYRTPNEGGLLFDFRVSPYFFNIR